MVNTRSLLRAANAALSSCQHAAVIALGSNLGNRANRLTQALHLLHEGGNLQVTRVSCLYESEPAHVKDQPRFCNAAVLVLTHLQPQQLLRELKTVEVALGRDLAGGPRYGPRPVDLDIIFYDDAQFVSGDPSQPGWLQIPHPRWLERTFVTAPLADLADAGTSLWASTKQPMQQGGWAFVAADATAMEISHPSGALNQSLHTCSPDAELQASAAAIARVQSQLHTAKEVWRQQEGSTTASQLQRVVPLANGECWRWSQRTQTMAVLNVTPDSFSDGGLHCHTDAAVQRAVELGVQKVDIIDIGGQSTRPGSLLLTPEQEMSRVVPVIRRVAACAELEGVLLSVDTFYAQVAAEAVAAGAHIVNDVSGGLADSNMAHTVSRLGVPYILMHMRGSPQTMMQPEYTQYTDVCTQVAAELAARGQEAFKAGVMPWSMILDPGLGFAKHQQHNLELVKGLKRMRQALPGTLKRQPILLGASRKGFLGRITGRHQAAERDWATAAIHALGVSGGANMLRGHHPAALVDTARVADAFMATARS